MKKLILGISIFAILSACDESKQLTYKDSAAKDATRLIADKSNIGSSATQKKVTVPTQQTINSPVITDIDNEIAQARTVISVFASTLKGELETGIKAGGAVKALEICNTKAPQIAEKITTEKGMQVSRVSLKNRSPTNAPNVWQKTVLENFATRKAAGTDPTALEFSEIVEHQDHKEFRFMKAIPTGEVCLACHGENLAKGVQETITTLYPDDKATGFKSGDIRGAFVVTNVLD
tara:strand:- start:35 stop:736 length:702 start_codon:yes stop_codon:yes gene_type:complete